MGSLDPRRIGETEVSCEAVRTLAKRVRGASVAAERVQAWAPL